MKKKHLFIPEANRWNALLRKFLNLYKRIKKGNSSEQQMNQMSSKLQRIYKRLEKMQYRVGIKLAGSALALMLVSVTSSSQNFTSLGNLTFKPFIAVESWSAPVFADIDDDADLDLYVGEYAGSVNVFVNDGTGIFSEAGNLQNVSGQKSEPEFADIDSDGDFDLYLGHYNGHIGVFLNNGSGSFSSAGYLQADGGNIDVGYFSSPVFSDIDDDSDLDLYVGEYFGTIKVFINDGTGTFSQAADMQADGADIDVGYISIPVFADVDNDNDLDLYVGEYFGSIKVFINDGTGTFSQVADLQADGTDIMVSYSSNPVFADIDDDADLDLYLGNNTGTIKIFTNNGTGIFSFADNMTLETEDIDLIYNSVPVFADLDDDSDLDLFIGAYDGKIKVYINDGTGIFSGGVNLESQGVVIDVGNNSVPEFADINGDYDLDLYVGESDGKIKVFINNGTGNFIQTGDLQSEGNPIDIGEMSAPKFADIDDDSDLDLFIGESYGRIKVYNNNGAGVFNLEDDLQADGSYIDVGNNSIPDFEDFDNDGDLDLYIGEESGTVKFYLNDGTGTFSSAGNLQTDGADIDVGFNSAPVFADINANYQKLFIGNQTGVISVYEDAGINIKEIFYPRISVFPNPSDGIFTIETDDSFNVSVVDMSGKLVKQLLINGSQKILDLSNQNSGVYFLKFQNDQTIKTMKIILN